ncbi:hypothetical protein H0O02_03305 [Candidatus Micrarchaeota archaeon]|nr:hypothetical protein [Candidatus Micrarchaeota archaeon]
MKTACLLAISLLFFGCLQQLTTITELNGEPATYIGKEINVKGTVENTVKLGELSGYTLTEGNESIRVSSKALPEEGKEITVSGTWMRDTIFGYYLLAKSG